MAYRYSGTSPDIIRITRVICCPTRFAMHGGSASRLESEYY